MRVLFIFILLSKLTLAQTGEKHTSNVLNKNNIHFNAGWSIIAYGIGLGYERLIPSKKNNIYSCLSVGAGLYEINFFGIDQYFVPSFQYGIITGIETEHHFDAKAGFALVMDRGTLGMNELSFLPAIKLGYRYQLPEEDFLFKAGGGFPDLIYVGLGFSF